jgi:hypothetical protein
MVRGLFPGHCSPSPCNVASMEYWRTRTIGEAMAAGYSAVRLTCSGCGRITDIPWKLLLQWPRITGESFIGNIPFKCEQCGAREPIIGVHRNVGGA